MLPSFYLYCFALKLALSNVMRVGIMNSIDSNPLYEAVLKTTLRRVHSTEFMGKIETIQLVYFPMDSWQTAASSASITSQASFFADPVNSIDVVIMCFFSSAEVLTILSTLEAASVPVIGVDQRASELANSTEHPFYIRVVGSSNVTSEAMLLSELVLTYDWTRLMVLFSDDNYGHVGAQILAHALADNAVEATLGPALPLNSTSSDIQRVLQKTPLYNVIIVLTPPRLAVEILNAMHAEGMYGRNFGLLLSESATTMQLFEGEHEALVSNYALTLRVFGGCTTFQQQQFQQVLFSEIESVPNSALDRYIWAPFLSDALMVVAHAVRTRNLAGLPPEQRGELMRRMRDVSFAGASGYKSFEPGSNDPVENVLHGVANVRNMAFRHIGYSTLPRGLVLESEPVWSGNSKNPPIARTLYIGGIFDLSDSSAGRLGVSTYDAAHLALNVHNASAQKSGDVHGDLLVMPESYVPQPAEGSNCNSALAFASAKDLVSRHPPPIAVLMASG